MKKNNQAISDELDPGGFSSIQAALGFCALGLLGVLIATSLIDVSPGPDRMVTNTLGNVDRTVTGSIEAGYEARSYTIRQSVMQSDPSVPCIIYDDGQQQGGC